MTTEQHYRFRGLERLASEHGLDVRSTVLRVATDLFCQTRIHPPADVLRYTDLAIALLETADATTRNAVAEKLSKAPHAPEKLLRYLLDDIDVTVAGTVLSNSPALKLENMAEFLAECGPAEAAAIARRTDIDAQTVRLLAGHPHLLVVEALLENVSLAFDVDAARLLVGRCMGHAPLAGLLFKHPSVGRADLAPLYPHAPKELRAEIRAILEERTPQPSTAVPIEALTELNNAVLAADRERIGASLGKALRLDPGGAYRLIDDPTGEVFALALLAAGIKRAPAIRLLLIAAVQDVRTSVERIFAAADIYETTSRRVAREIVAAVAGERRTAGAVFEPHMHPSATPQRTFGTRRRPLSQQQPSRRTDIIGKR
jgi:hypothetical protein